LQKILYIDMDNTLVDFRARLDGIHPTVRERYLGREDELPGLFALMPPIPGAIEAFHELSGLFDTYISSRRTVWCSWRVKRLLTGSWPSRSGSTPCNREGRTDRLCVVRDELEVAWWAHATLGLLLSDSEQKARVGQTQTSLPCFTPLGQPTASNSGMTLGGHRPEPTQRRARQSRVSG
jgi:hypothetical protein